MKKRTLSMVLAIVLAAAAIPWHTATASAAFTGALQFDADGKFTVMQLTDTQCNTSVDSRITNVITKSIARYSPDLIVFTGDNHSGMISKNTAQSHIRKLLDPIIAANVKFAVTFGNHDNDSIPLIANPGTLTEQYDYFKSYGGNSFIDHDVAALDGVGSGVIPIYANGQTSGAPAYQVYLMDSNDNASSGSYDCPYTSQVDYYIQRSLEYPDVPSLWFMHIIVPDIYTRTMTVDSSGITGQSSPFSSNKYILTPSMINWDRCSSTSVGDIYKEGPCPANLSVYESSAHRSSAQYGSKTLYESWASYGNLKGAYFGHDHKNEFTMTTADGIDLGYGESTGLTMAYNDDNPGVSVYELSIDGSYTTEYCAESDLTKAMISFKPNGGAGTMANQLVSKNTPVALNMNQSIVREGYEFAGWNTKADGSGVAYADGANISISADTVLFAMWNIVSLSNITFDANGGTGGFGPVPMTPGDGLTAPQVERTGYTFAGWQPEVPLSVPSGDTVYTAQWVANMYTVIYDGNANTAGMTVDSYHVYGTASPLTPNGFTKTGHSFLGWSADASATAPSYTDAQDVLNILTEHGAVVTFYAIWSINSYTVAFDANGGSGTVPAPQMASYASSLALPGGSGLKKTGYSFAGWGETPDAEVPLGEYVIGDCDATLFAVWSENPTIEADNGSTTIINSNTGIITGLAKGLTIADFESRFVSVSENGRLEYTTYNGSIGTGTKVELINDRTGEVVETYTIVVYGDLNGDGMINALDADTGTLVQNWILNWDPVAERYFYLAGDLNLDGRVDSIDADIINNYENWLMEIDQTTGLAS